MGTHTHAHARRHIYKHPPWWTSNNIFSHYGKKQIRFGLILASRPESEGRKNIYYLIAAIFNAYILQSRSAQAFFGRRAISSLLFFLLFFLHRCGQIANPSPFWLWPSLPPFMRNNQPILLPRNSATYLTMALLFCRKKRINLHLKFE